jgi:hypothetical protein
VCVCVCVCVCAAASSSSRKLMSSSPCVVVDCQSVGRLVCVCARACVRVCGACRMEKEDAHAFVALLVALGVWCKGGL